VWCWGAGRSEPRRIEGLTTRVRGLAAGADHSCALAGDRVSCWAADADRARPVEGLPAGVALSFLAAGGDRTCAASADAAWCWRRGEVAAAAIAAVEGLDGPLHALAVGRDHACAQQGDRVLCWGDDDAGQLGRGVGLRRDPRAAPVADWDRGQWRDANGDGRITLVCLGDSNTQAMAGAEPPWCDRLAPLLGDEVRVVNRGIGGATAGPSLVEAASVLAYVLENDAPDLAVLAYGTNDVLAGHAIEDVVASLARLDRALLAAGARSWIALVPPMRSGDAHAAQGAALNDALRGIFPEERRIDFASGLTDADLLDRVHLGGAAQQRLAERAALAIGRRRPGNAR
jgi:lysophospholipase L1-like esterase